MDSSAITDAWVVLWECAGAFAITSDKSIPQARSTRTQRAPIGSRPPLAELQSSGYHEMVHDQFKGRQATNQMSMKAHGDKLDSDEEDSDEACNVLTMTVGDIVRKNNQTEVQGGDRYAQNASRPVTNSNLTNNGDTDTSKHSNVAIAPNSPNTSWHPRLSPSQRSAAYTIASTSLTHTFISAWKETISALITRSVRSHFLHPLARYPSLITSVRLRQYSPAALDKWVADKMANSVSTLYNIINDPRLSRGIGIIAFLETLNECQGTRSLLHQTAHSPSDPASTSNQPIPSAPISTPSCANLGHDNNTYHDLNASALDDSVFFSSNDSTATSVTSPISFVPSSTPLPSITQSSQFRTTFLSRVQKLRAELREQVRAQIFLGENLHTLTSDKKGGKGSTREGSGLGSVFAHYIRNELLRSERRLKSFKELVREYNQKITMNNEVGEYNDDSHNAYGNHSLITIEGTDIYTIYMAPSICNLLKGDADTSNPSNSNGTKNNGAQGTSSNSFLSMLDPSDHDEINALAFMQTCKHLGALGLTSSLHGALVTTVMSLVEKKANELLEGLDLVALERERYRASGDPDAIQAAETMTDDEFDVPRGLNRSITNDLLLWLHENVLPFCCLLLHCADADTDLSTAPLYSTSRDKKKGNHQRSSHRLNPASPFCTRTTLTTASLSSTSPLVLSPTLSTSSCATPLSLSRAFSSGPTPSRQSDVGSNIPSPKQTPHANRPCSTYGIRYQSPNSINANSSSNSNSNSNSSSNINNNSNSNSTSPSAVHRGGGSKGLGKTTTTMPAIGRSVSVLLGSERSRPNQEVATSSMTDTNGTSSSSSNDIISGTNSTSSNSGGDESPMPNPSCTGPSYSATVCPSTKAHGDTNGNREPPAVIVVYNADATETTGASIDRTPSSDQSANVNNSNMNDSDNPTTTSSTPQSRGVIFGDLVLRTPIAKLQALLEYFVLQHIARLRISRVFDIIVDHPASQPALDDLQLALSKTNEHPQLLHSLQQQIRLRLLHPGAPTQAILEQLYGAVKALRTLDPTGVATQVVTDLVRNYLRSRHDTVNEVVKCLIGEGAVNLTDSLDPASLHASLASTALISSMGPDLSPEAIAAATAAAGGEGNDSDVEAVGGVDPPYASHWWPAPATADPLAPWQARLSDDIVGVFASLASSPVHLLNQYRSILGRRILSRSGFVEDELVAVVERLKLRFGETALTHAEVMLADVANSKRINTRIRAMLKELPEIKPFSPTVDSTVTFEFFALSEQFWPDTWNKKNRQALEKIEQIESDENVSTIHKNASSVNTNTKLSTSDSTRDAHQEWFSEGDDDKDDVVCSGSDSKQGLQAIENKSQSGNAERKGDSNRFGSMGDVDIVTNSRPSLRNGPRLPRYLRLLHRRFEAAYHQLKSPRRLIWQPYMAEAEVELTLLSHTVTVKCDALSAVIISLFHDAPVPSVTRTSPPPLSATTSVINSNLLSRATTMPFMPLSTAAPSVNLPSSSSPSSSPALPLTSLPPGVLPFSTICRRARAPPEHVLASLSFWINCGILKLLDTQCLSEEYSSISSHGEALYCLTDEEAFGTPVAPVDDNDDD